MHNNLLISAAGLMEMHVAFGDVQEGYDVVEKVGEVCRKNL